LIEKIWKISHDFYHCTHEQRKELEDFQGKLIHDGSAFSLPVFDGSVRANAKIDLVDVDKTFDLYIKEITTLALRLAAWFEVALGLQPGKLLDRMEPHGVQNALCYERTPEGKWGVPAHFDNGFITVLMQGDIGGLEAMHNGEWYYLPPKKDTFVINFGNMLEHISYGVIKATWHQVRNTTAKFRWSWPTFFVPLMDGKLTRLKEFSWNAERLAAIQKDKKFSADENQTFKEWFKENVVTSDKFLKSIEYGKIYHHVWEMVERGGVFEIKEFNQARKDRE